MITKVEISHVKITLLGGLFDIQRRLKTIIGIVGNVEVN